MNITEDPRFKMSESITNNPQLRDSERIDSLSVGGQRKRTSCSNSKEKIRSKRIKTNQDTKQDAVFSLSWVLLRIKEIRIDYKESRYIDSVQDALNIVSNTIHNCPRFFKGSILSDVKDVISRLTLIAISEKKMDPHKANILFGIVFSMEEQLGIFNTRF